LELEASCYVSSPKAHITVKYQYGNTILERGAKEVGLGSQIGFNKSKYPTQPFGCFDPFGRHLIVIKNFTRNKVGLRVQTFAFIL